MLLEIFSMNGKKSALGSPGHLLIRSRDVKTFTLEGQS